MKLPWFFFFLAAAAIVPAAHAGVLQIRTPCGNTANLVRLRRLYNPTTTDHFYTWAGLTEAQYLGLGYIQDGDNDPNPAFHDSAGKFFLSQEPGTVPLYRLFNAATSTHQLTSNAAFRDSLIAAGFVLDGNDSAPGIAGYVYLDGSCPGTVPLFWTSSAALSDNFYTVNAENYNTISQSPGFQGQGIVAWMYPVACEF